MSFVVIPRAQNRFIGLKKSFILITPTPKFWRWRSLFGEQKHCLNQLLDKVSKTVLVQNVENNF
jgi:hypothetical protein